ncbi:hypothetical protein Fot_19544 [Forsythia ovata]|uniref:Uncharacterized protein n=1 Tax=Forsythia ovata TaxID=205694 RepID=A0ABD1VLF2_9LAMI
MSLLVGLVRMKSLDDLKGMVSAIGTSKVVEVYMPLCGDEPQVEIPTQDDGCYVPDKGSHQWDNVEWGDILDGVGVDVSQDWESDFIESFVRRSGSEELRQ